MGTWFLSSFVANYAGGIFAGQYDNMDPDRFFNILAATAAVAALALLALVPLLKKWMKDDQPADMAVKIPIEANY
jgi:dipeptide/tripeptide permease